MAATAKVERRALWPRHFDSHPAGCPPCRAVLRTVYLALLDCCRVRYGPGEASSKLDAKHFELEEIESIAKTNNLRVGLMLDMRDHGNLICLRDIVKSGRIGEVQTVAFSAQHPLLWGIRPSWYFEPGMHGGTLNDIAIHALDFLPWVTGLTIEKVEAARTWNAKATGAPHFNDCGQFLLRLSNGGGVFGDVSYLAPDKCGYAIPNYWRITVHGTKGFAETSYGASGVSLADDDSAEPERVAP
ncbi:MAG: Gfo/Idh/MocA family protein, partial [Terrimicrobiaceae bacterium]